MSIRLGFFLVFLACAGLLGYAYYTQFVLYLDPCPLCILQRLAFIVMGIAALLGALHGPRGGGRWVYAGLIGAGAAWGAITAGRHTWLQAQPPPEGIIPDCGPGLGHMLENFPLNEAIRMAFTGGGDCAEIDWTFLGLSMPAWTLIWFILLAGFTLWFLTRQRRIRI